MPSKPRLYLTAYMWAFALSALWMLTDWFPAGPRGPILKFGFENNAAIFLINAVLLGVMTSFVFYRFAFLLDKEAAAYKDRSLTGRLKWFGLNYIEAFIFFGLASIVDFYVSGKIGLRYFGIENDLVLLLIDNIIVAAIFTPVLAWTNAWRHREEHEKENTTPGFFERLGYNASRYLRRGAGKSGI
jgi:hypothetical protein